MKIKIFLILLACSTLQLQEFNSDSILFRRIKEGILSKKRLSCLSDLTGKNLTSKFSDLFNPECAILTTCYKNKNSTKSECNEKFLENLISKCEALRFQKRLCYKNAKEWKIFVDNNLDDFYIEKSELKKVKFLNLNTSLILSQAYYNLFILTNLTSQLSLFNIIPVGDNNFVIKNNFSNYCLQYFNPETSSEDDITMWECDLEKKDQHWFFSNSEKEGFLFVRSVLALEEGVSGECLYEDGDLEVCIPEEPGINWLVLYENGEIVKVEDLGLETKD